MTKYFERTALILLAGTALSLGSFASSAVATDYKVRKGDTLAEIADRLDTSIETLAKTNGLRKPYRLMPGQVLKDPNAAKVASKTAAKKVSAKSKPKREDSYTVRSGDTLFSIAKRLGTSVEALKAENEMGRSSAISPGRKLRVPGSQKLEAVSEPEAETPTPRARRGAELKQQSETEAPVSGTGRSATGRVVTIETPGKAYRVRKGDTLEKVARKLDSEIDDLARINRLKKPYRLQPGQTIRGPGGSTRGYAVARGDTLAEIAQRFSVSVDKLRAANGLRRGAAVAPGRKLRLPSGYRDRGPIQDAPRETTLEPAALPRTPPVEVRPPTASGSLPTAPQPYIPSTRPQRPPSSTFTPQGSVNGAPVASPALSDAQVMQLGRGLFDWPVRGEMISGFGGRGSGPRNDGVNIRARSGDPVRSAASGEIVYAGDQVPGFGNLVLVKHADGWVTAYGHLSRVGVKMQQKVTQGQQIGEAGQSGGVSEPQLHFEIRYAPTPQERARPIDPELVLPR